MLGRIFFIGFTFCFLSFSFDQDAQKILDNAQLVLDKNYFGTELVYTTVEVASGNIVSDEKRGYYKLFDSGYVQQIDNLVTIQEDSVRVIIDHSLKQIVIAEYFPVLPVIGIDLENFDSSNFEITSQSTDDYHSVNFKIKKGYSEFSEVNMSYNKDYFPEELVLKFKAQNEQEKAESLSIDFVDFHLDPKKEPKDKLSYFISFNKEHYEPTDNFKSYKLSDYR